MDDQDEFNSFVELLIERLKREGLVEPTRSEDGNTLIIDSVQTNLRSLFRTYKLQPDDVKEQQVDAFVRIIGRVQNDSDDSESFEEASPNLRPKLWGRWMFAGANLEAIGKGNKSFLDMPTRLVGEHHMLSIVYDHPESIASIPWSKFNQWEVSFDEAIEVAVQNVESETQMMGVQASDDTPGHCSMATGDNYDSVRFLSERPAEQFQIGYPRWAFPASRDTLALANGEQSEHLNFGIDLALEMAESDPKRLPPFPLINHGNGWITWEPDSAYQVPEKLIEKQREYLIEIYREQTFLLQSTAVERSDFSSVQALNVDESGDSPETTTVWAGVGENLLPQADYVIFPDRNGLRVPWKAVEASCEDLLARAEALYPARWRTMGYPIEEQFREMS